MEKTDGKVYGFLNPVTKVFTRFENKEQFVQIMKYLENIGCASACAKEEIFDDFDNIIQEVSQKKLGPESHNLILYDL